MSSNLFSLERLIRANLANLAIFQNENLSAEIILALRVDEKSVLAVNLVSNTSKRTEDSIETILRSNPRFVEEMISYDIHSSNKNEYLGFVSLIINELLNNYSYSKKLALKFPRFAEKLREKLNSIYNSGKILFCWIQ